MLHPKPLLDGLLQKIVLNRSHGCKLTNLTGNRKLKNPARLNLPIALTAFRE